MAGNWLKLRLCARAGSGAPPSPDVTAVVFGALTRSGVGGGVPTTATAIASGDPTGHFQVTSGVLCVSTTGDTANLNGGPYSLVMNDGSEFLIAVEANCWSCSTQTEWDFLIAQATATLSGKIIRARRLPGDGVYASGVDGSAIRLRRADYGGLVIKGDDTSLIPDGEDDIGPTSFPIFDRFVLRGARNITFEHLDTDTSTAKVFDLIAETANHCSGITIRNCRVRGEPGDPNGDYTGRIDDEPLAVGDGVTTTFTGTLDYLPYSGTAGISPHVQGLKIVAGAIVAATTGSGTTFSGTGVTSGSIVFATGVYTVTFSSPPANGVPVAATYNSIWHYPNNDLITTTGSAAWIENLTIVNNHITWGLRAINVVCGVGALITSGNRCKYFFDDGINVSYPGANILWTCEDNVLSHPIGKGTDCGNPHVDAIRGAANVAATTDWAVKINRNRIFHGDSRGDMQCILLSDFKSSGVDSGFFFTGEIIGNIMTWQTTQALAAENAKGMVVLNNTVVAENALAGGTVSISVGSGSTDSTTSGTHRLERNIAESYSLGGSPTLVDNQTLGAGGATIAYSAMFDGPTWNADTLAELMTFFNRKAGGPGDLAGGPPDAGAIGSGAVTWATSVPGSDGVCLVA